MKTKVVNLKPGNVIRINEVQETVKRTSYLKDNVRVRMEFVSGVSLVRGQFEEVDLVSR